MPNIDSYSLNSQAQKDYILTTLGIDEIIVEYIYIITPIAEGLSHIIDGEILTEVEGGGTLTLENEYKQDVPFTWTFQERL